MKIPAALRRGMDALTPWPSRRHRKAAISRARALKEQSRQDAARAAAVRADITRLAERNHFAASLAQQIIARHRQQGAG